jgi:hypothetical protein
MIDEKLLGKNWKKTTVVQFEKLSQHLTGGAGENMKNLSG